MTRSTFRVLSNGQYTVFLTAAGAGCSMSQGVALTPWDADPWAGPHGFFFYLRDLDDGTIGSAAHAPLAGGEPAGGIGWEPGRAVVANRWGEIETAIETCVVPDAPVEIRRLLLRNHGTVARRIEMTSYAEVVLAEGAVFASHPAFSKLFVQTEFVASPAALLARRRPRSADERTPVLVHALLDATTVEHETDRTRFRGRARSLAAPAALGSKHALTGTTGNVLDPIVALRATVDLPPGGEAVRAFLLGCGDGREAALAHATRFASADAVRAAFEAAEQHASALLEQVGMPASEARAAEELAGGFGPFERAVLVRADRHGGVADRLLRLRAYWQAQGVPVDWVFVVEGAIPDRLVTALGADSTAVILQRADLSSADVEELEQAAALVLDGDLPERSVRTTLSLHADVRRPEPSGKPSAPAPEPQAGDDEPLLFFNGLGGFSADGREYVLRLANHAGELALPPRPWINVLANESFGCLWSERGAATTWSGNSRTHRLTPWSNDPLVDPHTEAFYVRDDENGAAWSPFPGPIAGAGDYEVRHGFGTSTWRHRSGGLAHESLVFVPRADPLRVVRIRIRNESGRPRRLSLFAYAQLVLGTTPDESGRHVITRLDPETHLVTAHNRKSSGFAGCEAFAAAVPPAGALAVHATSDRTAFLGALGSVGRPAALAAPHLDGGIGFGIDACAAHQVVLELAPEETAETHFLLGEGSDGPAARALWERYRDPAAIEQALAEVRTFWKDLLGTVRVVTPSPALDLMLNGWLLYQMLACRLWGRSALYQSGGAFGYRDQLQDATALVLAWPGRLRQQILLHAEHQFVEGDVLHWWHPPDDLGLRTRFADDLLWLPYVTACYIRSTGDFGLLDEVRSFVDAPQLDTGEDEVLLHATRVAESADLYEHCCRAIDRSLGRGAHGLPFFGTGDWNDGMNRVGREGRGESVWMAFFLYTVLEQFAPLCERRGDRQRVQRYAAHCEALRGALETGGWDGAWYRRGYYDDGTPLGSSMNEECRIDVLVQAWAVLSGAVPHERARQAMASAGEQLVSERDGLIRLLTPPFAHTDKDPGYIKGYVAGVRENGGQYTHAALWFVRALAMLGRNDRAEPLLRMLNPIHHAATPEQVETYQVEPYVVAADVYGTPPHVGRGGWTWYTGSAAWMYRVGLESILGLQLEGGDTLVLRPCVPDDWPAFTIDYRAGETSYRIRASNAQGSGRGVREARLDGHPVRVEDGAARVPLAGDGRAHVIDLVLGAVS